MIQRARATQAADPSRRNAMTQDATSAPSETTDTASATEDDDTQAQQMLAEAAAQPAEADAGDTNEPAEQPERAKDAKSPEDKLGDSGKRALTSERRARRDAERQLNELRSRLQEFEDRDKTDLQKAIERAEAAERGASDMRVANARLMAAAIHNIPPDLIDLLGSGTEEEIDARAKLLAEKLTAVAPPTPPQDDRAVEPPRPTLAQRRPVESLTPGAKPANAEPEDPDAWLRRMAGRRT